MGPDTAPENGVVFEREKVWEKSHISICAKCVTVQVSAGGEFEVALLPFWKGPQSLPEVFNLSALPSSLCHREVPTRPIVAG